MARYAVIRDGVVENVTIWDGVTPWAPPEGSQATPCGDQVAIGWLYDGTAWSAPAEAAESAPTPLEVAQDMARAVEDPDVQAAVIAAIVPILEAAETP